ncbi:MAG TPA: DUF6338 family protein [Ktedonobacteraceae bacterium]|nr:DUF6338 family protein [Ktedonobacteraceae bacterium]
MEALLSSQVLPIFLIFVVPGVVATKVYSYLIPSERRQLTDYLVELVTFSMFYLALFFWLINLLYLPGVQSRGYLFYPLLLLAVFVIPACLGWAGSYLMQAQWLRRLTKSATHPVPLSWDYIFSKGEPYWIIFHLKNGKMIGGYYSSGSFASGYPDVQEIYVQEIWALDEFGRFRQRIGRTAGGYIKAEDCDFVEFFSV